MTPLYPLNQGRNTSPSDISFDIGLISKLCATLRKLPQNKVGLIILCSLFFVQLNSQLRFINPSLESGIALQDGAVYRFRLVNDNSDALVTIIGRSHPDIAIIDLDVAGGGSGIYWQPQIDYNYLNDDFTCDPSGYKSVDFRIDFVETGTNNLTFLNDVYFSGVDIDGSGDDPNVDNGEISETLEVMNYASYSLGSPSLLQLSANLFVQGPNANYADISIGAPEVAITFSYQTIQTIYVSPGSYFGGNCTVQDEDESRYHSYYFDAIDLPAITNNCELTANLGEDKYFCADKKHSLSPLISGNTCDLYYQWSTGQTSSNIIVHPKATTKYYVTVSDCNGCQAIDSITLYLPDFDLSCSDANINPAGCGESKTGSIQVHPSGGYGAYAYHWSNGAKTQTINNLSSGTYTVTVVDAQNCECTSSFKIDNPVNLDCSIEIDSYVACGCIDNGKATVHPSGGIGPYEYLWSNGETTQQATTLSIGNHSVTVTDATGCDTVCSIKMDKDPSCCVVVRSNGFTTSFVRN